MSELPPRLVKGTTAEYHAIAWSGEDTSGIRCVGPHVLILVHEASEVRTSGVYRTADEIEKANMACEMGIVVAMAAGAFRLYEDGRPWKDEERPQLGDRVYFEKYAGRLCVGLDGLTYRLMDYRAIGCIYDRDIENVRRHAYVMDASGRAQCQHCEVFRHDVIAGTAPRVCSGERPKPDGSLHDFGSDGECVVCHVHRVDVARGFASANCTPPEKADVQQVEEIA